MEEYKKRVKKTLQQRRKDAKIRRIVFLVLVLLFLCGIVLLMWAIFKDKDDNKNNGDKTNVSNSSVSIIQSSSSENAESDVSSDVSSAGSVSSESASSVVSQSVSSKTVSQVQTSSKSSSQQSSSDWRLIVVNKNQPLSSSFTVATASVGTLSLDKRIVKDYNAMIAAAKADGITLKIISGYRTNTFQTNNYNNKVNKYINQGYTKEQAAIEAAKYVASPGTSEHQTGLAVDLISTNWYSYNSDLNHKFDQTKEFKWLYKNCAQYGFILRYPSGKEEVTMISYEPWHYRYVGAEHAKKIMESGVCLEEYVESLK